MPRAPPSPPPPPPPPPPGETGDGGTAAHAASDAAFRDGSALGAHPRAVSQWRMTGHRIRRRGRGRVVAHPGGSGRSRVIQRRSSTAALHQGNPLLQRHARFPAAALPLSDPYAQQFPRPPDAGRIGERTPRHMLIVVVRQRRQVLPPPHPGDAARPCRTVRLCLCPLHTGGAQGGRIAAPGERGRAGGVRGFDLRQVRRVLDTFPRENVLILQNEASCRRLARASSTGPGSSSDRGWVPAAVQRPEAAACAGPPFLSSNRRGQRLAEAYAEEAAHWPRSHRRSISRRGRARPTWRDRRGNRQEHYQAAPRRGRFTGSALQPATGCPRRASASRTSGANATSVSSRNGPAGQRHGEPRLSRVGPLLCLAAALLQ